MLPFPWKNSKYELQILSQPEDQHRARYLTEGSRGAVKDITGQSHPMIKINGYDKPVVLQIFIGTDAGKVKPHGFYQACKVSGKNSTPCSQKDIQGTTVIEIQLEPGTDMTALVDCVGILKLRNADVEQRTKLCRSKKKSTKARMVFRVNVPKGDGFYDTLQIASTPILCTQPAGAPEVSKMSMEEGSVEGNQELFIIGKNFMKGTGVFFEETHGSTLTWSKEAELDTDYFQTTHLICKVPPYHDQGVFHNVSVDIVVRSSGKSSDPVPFTYKSSEFVLFQILPFFLFPVFLSYDPSFLNFFLLL
ncbi:hypothetical protein CAPTEDRAFT_175869 [Capitella teleta]|uniref:RHD domain-containing protein n=1 Tax=Capitella teleta TaxID=283909 RepID=R7T4V0_CAPTE|nr:hypothetical protein CAPTEDRAFT_175869 [Capitella teleta]|eukprot:ELT87926.1 hypothetical protein CAPTEDRAFT_175869 [Capitella teleta]